MRGTRILRYVGNREIPEKELYSPLERMIQFSGMRSQADFALTGDFTVFNKIPNPLWSDFKKMEDGPLFVPEHPQDDLLGGWLSPLFSWGLSLRPKSGPQKPAEVDFEVNMMEALIGWKSWFVDSGILKSHSGNCLWHADKATEAVCDARCKKVPAEHHTCGIYASESRQTAEEYGNVLGRVHGWGRYIRHEGGWKAQFAYPRCFYLREEQIDLVETLKQYHVPIYVSQPMTFYHPAEEGYDGYWTEEENGDCGAAEVAAPGEAGSPGEDHED